MLQVFAPAGRGCGAGWRRVGAADVAQDGGGVGGELRELRRHYGRTLYRILYRRSRNLFILLHALRKNTGRIPAADIAVAQARWDDFKARMDAARRTPPRAAGHPMVRPLGRRAG